jgi:Zn ribbon nucleic-acid-binding protein
VWQGYVEQQYIQRTCPFRGPWRTTGAPCSKEDALAWWENDGFQNFTQHILSSSLRGATDVLAVDIDFDGDLDLATTAGDLDELAWWENDGQLNYTKHVLDTGLHGAAGVEVTDLDVDGDLDLIGIGEKGDVLAWWENDGNTRSGLHNQFAGNN